MGQGRISSGRSTPLRTSCTGLENLAPDPGHDHFTCRSSRMHSHCSQVNHGDFFSLCSDVLKALHRRSNLGARFHRRLGQSPCCLKRRFVPDLGHHASDRCLADLVETSHFSPSVPSGARVVSDIGFLLIVELGIPTAFSPLAAAAFKPTRVRSRVTVRSNSAHVPTICICMCPAGVVVSMASSDCRARRLAKEPILRLFGPFKKKEQKVISK